VRVQPLIAVRDVVASSRWYQELLGAKSGHGGSDYERLVHDGEVLLQLHRQDAHEHPHLCDLRSPRGNGVLLWFRTDAFDAAVARARALGAPILEEPHLNPNAHHRECWLRDPDGYTLVLASARGDVG
jgi:catechol 2,3-dioxygenase-like lactoylglutathione lyase family enzyme